MKVGIAASLVGTIVGELPTGAIRGLGARLLTGSYYGQTVQMWAALFAAALARCRSRRPCRYGREGDTLKRIGDGAMIEVVLDHNRH